LNVFVGVGLLVGDVTLNGRSRGIALGLLRWRQNESLRIPGHARLLDDHRNHEVVALPVMRGHVLRHRRRGHRKWSTRLTNVLAGILHGNLRVRHGLIMLTRHAGAGGHLVGIYGSIHGVSRVLKYGRLRVGGDWSVRGIGERTVLTLSL